MYPKADEGENSGTPEGTHSAPSSCCDRQEAKYLSKERRTFALAALPLHALQFADQGRFPGHDRAQHLKEVIREKEADEISLCPPPKGEFDGSPNGREIALARSKHQAVAGTSFRTPSQHNISGDRNSMKANSAGRYPKHFLHDMPKSAGKIERPRGPKRRTRAHGWKEDQVHADRRGRRIRCAHNKSG